LNWKSAFGCRFLASQAFLLCFFDYILAARSLREVIAAPQGNLIHERNEAFLLHVFWEAPSLAAATKLPAGLQQCATATHCVTTNFFRISTHDTELCEKRFTVSGHPQLIVAKKKIQCGARPQAVHLKRRIDPALLDGEDSTPLVQPLHPVAVDFTERYLDERSFMEHAGSIFNQSITSDHMTSPSDNIIETILEPILHENVAPVTENCIMWRTPKSVTTVCMFCHFTSLYQSVVVLTKYYLLYQVN